MHKCTKCGTEFEGNFCPECGEKWYRENDYPACGTSVESEEKPGGDASETIVTPEENFEETAPKRKTLSEKTVKLLDKILLALYITGTVGIVLFLGIVIIGAAAYGKVYLFDGYTFTVVLSIISIIFMMIGLLSVIAKVILCFSLKIGTFPTTWVKRILLLLLAICCLSFSIWGFVDCGIVNSEKDDYGSGSGSSYNDYTVSPSLGLSLKVTSIKQSGNYSYVYCSITNISSLYGTATMYRYVKVKAVFYDRYNTMLDTDWTYAIDSAWLSSGEVKTFYFMVRNTSVYSAKLSIIS